MSSSEKQSNISISRSYINCVVLTLLPVRYNKIKNDRTYKLSDKYLCILFWRSRGQIFDQRLTESFRNFPQPDKTHYWIMLSFAVDSKSVFHFTLIQLFPHHRSPSFTRMVVPPAILNMTRRACRLQKGLSLVLVPCSSVGTDNGWSHFNHSDNIPNNIKIIVTTSPFTATDLHWRIYLFTFKMSVAMSALSVTKSKRPRVVTTSETEWNLTRSALNAIHNLNTKNRKCHNKIVKNLSKL